MQNKGKTTSNAGDPKVFNVRKRLLRLSAGIVGALCLVGGAFTVAGASASAGTNSSGPQGNLWVDAPGCYDGSTAGTQVIKLDGGFNSNELDAVKVTFDTPYGSVSSQTSTYGTASFLVNTNKSSVPAGTVTATVTWADGTTQGTSTFTADYPAGSCDTSTSSTTTSVPSPTTTNKPPKKVHKSYVCKYVGKPGVNERLQTGQNPIWVDNHSLKGSPDYTYVGEEFKDGQFRSVVIVANTPKLNPEPGISQCPPAQGPPPTTVPSPTTTTSVPSPTTTTTPPVTTTTPPVTTTSVPSTTTTSVPPTTTTTTPPVTTTTTATQPPVTVTKTTTPGHTPTATKTVKVLVPGPAKTTSTLTPHANIPVAAHTGFVGEDYTVRMFGGIMAIMAAFLLVLWSFGGPKAIAARATRRR